MADKLKISSYSLIRNNQIFLNGKEVFNGQSEENNAEFLKSSFRSLGFKYPKYFKMDNLSKVAFLAAEVMLKDQDIKDRFSSERTGIILLTGSSSLHTDQQHFETICDKNNYFPSPAIFVYTLPNIMLGELCIRHKITGENYCLVSENFNPDLIFDYLNILFSDNLVDVAIAGWAEANMDDDNSESFIFLVERENAENHNKFLNFETETLKNIYFNPEIINGRIN